MNPISKQKTLETFSPGKEPNIRPLVRNLVTNT